MNPHFRRSACLVVGAALLLTLGGCETPVSKSSTAPVRPREEIIGASLPPAATAAKSSGGPGGGATAGRPAGSAATATSATGPYSPEALREAFAAVCRALKYRIVSLEVDQTEFPYLLYGVIDGRADYTALRDILQSMSEYTYSGSVTATAGGGSQTLFAINIIPRGEYDRDASGAALDRMKELANPRR